MINKTLVLTALAAISTTALADIQSLSAEKQAELANEGITTWPATTPQTSAGFSPVTAKSAGAAAKATGTLQYDDGNLTALPTIFGQIYGNRFNRGQGGAAITGAVTLNSFSFFFMEDSLADTGLIFQPADFLNASQISARASINVGGLTNSGPSFSSPVLNTRDQSVLGTTGVFSNTIFLGAWSLNANSNFPVDNEAIGLSTAGYLGGFYQGYTADSGAPGAVDFAPQDFNAMIRANVTGEILPVELMGFEVK